MENKEISLNLIGGTGAAEGCRLWDGPGWPDRTGG